MAKVGFNFKNSYYLSASVFIAIVNILEDVNIAENAIANNTITPEGRLVYYINRTLTNPESLFNNPFWLPVNTFFPTGFSFVVEWLPVNILDFLGYLIRINSGTEFEFSVRLIDPAEASDTLTKILVLRIPGFSNPVRIPLSSDDIPDTNELWQYGLSRNESHVSFWFKCTESSVVTISSGKRGEFLIFDNSTLEIGNANGIHPFYVSTNFSIVMLVRY